MAKKLYDFVGDTTAATAIEYAVLVAGIFLAIAVVLPHLSEATEAMFGSIAAAVKR